MTLDWLPEFAQSHRDEFTWALRIQGNCVELFRKQNLPGLPLQVPRGVVTMFSRSARMRMLRLIAKINWQEVGNSTFVTLTYPDSHYDRKNALRTMDRSQFIRDLEKFTHKKIPVLWRCEWQPRKTGTHRGLFVPHFHLLVFGVPFIPHQEVRQWWRRILDVKGSLATDVRKVVGIDGAGRYLAKYVSKYTSLDNGAYLNNPWMTGRHWGLTRPSLVPRALVEEDCLIDAFEADMLRQWFAERNPYYKEFGLGGFTALGESRKKEALAVMGKTS